MYKFKGWCQLMLVLPLKIRIIKMRTSTNVLTKQLVTHSNEQSPS